MSKRQRLISRMTSAPQSIRFAEVETLLKQEGFIIFNRRGSHVTFHRRDGGVLTVVRPHGGHKHCHPADIRKILKALGLA